MSKSITHQGRTYRKRKGLEGPFLYRSGPDAPCDSGLVLYYDHNEGLYYDSAHDLYIDPPGGDPANMDRHISEYVRRGKNPRKAAPVDKYAARQLVLFAENNEHLWNRRRPEFLKNMARKIKSGKLDVSKLPKLWKYFADEAAKEYQAEFGRDWSFSPATRRAAAKVFAEDALGEFESGDVTPAQLLRKR